MDFMKLLGTVIAVLFHPASSSKINGKRNREETKWCFITRLLKNPQSFDSEFLVKPRTETSSPTLNLFLFLLRPQLRCAAENTFQFGAFDVYDFRWWWWWGRKNNPKRCFFLQWRCDTAAGKQRARDAVEIVLSAVFVMSGGPQWAVVRSVLQ